VIGSRFNDILIKPCSKCFLKALYGLVANSFRYQQHLCSLEFLVNELISDLGAPLKHQQVSKRDIVTLFVN